MELEYKMNRRSSYEYDDLLACGRGELFGPGNAQLPAVRPDLWFFPCHFIGDPVMPGCLGLDALWQLTGFYLGWLGAEGRGRALGVGEVKFSDQVVPSVKKVIYKVSLKRVFRSKLVLGIADGILEADGRTIYEAKDLRVGLFKTDDA